MRTNAVVTSTNGTSDCQSPAMHLAPRALRRAVAAATIALLATAVGCAPQPEDKTSDNASASTGTTCVKGKFGWDFVNSPQRLTHPLIRENGAFREASWDEALDRVV